MITINEEQQLFVIPCGDGFTCIGFENLEWRAMYLARELTKLGHCIPAPALFGTLERYGQYRECLALAESEHKRTGWRSASELILELIGLEGKKVEVRHKWPSGEEERARFKVGKSTGFIPCHLELKRRNSSGGAAVCLGEILSVKVL